MPRPRFTKLPADRRAAILEAAGRRFAVDGFAAASFNRILADAGVSKGAAYYYFDDKADLFATTIEHAAADLVAFDVDGLDRDGFWPVLEQLYVEQLRSFASRPWQGRVARAVPAALSDPIAGPALAIRLAPLAATLEALRDKAIQFGLVRTDLPQALVFAMLRQLDDAIDGWLLDNPEHAADEALCRSAFAALKSVVDGGRP